MFKRFGALNALDLLHLQSELLSLEAQLKEVETEDAQNDEGDKLKLKSFSSEEPTSWDLKDIQHFLASSNMKSTLMGLIWETWGIIEKPECYSKELICLRPREDIDSFSRRLGTRGLKYITLFGCARSNVSTLVSAPLL
ncbi:hypothetical protein CC80DRAFT_554240 [Byssothecium circinans]|uniref:DUF6594 domain-containing protein n=1 Tax=Byssothecium circinans TaxID=147558 RepID=A0A6A5TD02_9PLEO|nr:hypothetical protein CC80DRAFT_554240 [Byssothecium circinans]